MTAAIQFLHIGKTGGNAVRAALRPLIDDGRVVWHRHAVNLADIAPGQAVAFFVRDPVSRFVSGFNSRLRCGRPAKSSPWKPDERTAFERFPTPDALASALAGPEGEARDAAKAAMHAIAHVNKPLSHFLTSADLVESRRDDIRFIGFQETLAADFQRMTTVLGLPAEIKLPEDPVVAHRTPEGFETGLSDAGRAAIEAWYAEDIVLYARLKAIAAGMTA